MEDPETRPKIKTTFTEFVEQFLCAHRNDVNTIISIDQLFNASGIEKRRLYDLMNVLVACGICYKFDAHSYQWVGFSSLDNFLPRISHEVEIRAIHGDIQFLFNLPKSPTIGNLVIRFLGLFLYFGIPSFRIKDIALLFSSEEEKLSHILRRLYLVSFFLERIGIMRHSTKVSQCQINADLRKLLKNTFETMSRNCEFPPDCVQHHLSRFDDIYITQVRIDRRELLFHQLQAKAEKVMKESKEYSTDLLKITYEIT